MMPTYIFQYSATCEKNTHQFLLKNKATGSILTTLHFSLEEIKKFDLQLEEVAMFFIRRALLYDNPTTLQQAKSSIESIEIMVK